MKVVVTGFVDVLKEINRVTKAYNEGVDDAVVATAVNIQRDAILGINKQNRGDKKTSKGHYPSPEGGYPNTDTGRLVGSIQVDHVKGSQEAIVYSDLDYAAYLEFLMNRPWLSTASMDKDKVLKENILTFTKKAIK